MTPEESPPPRRPVAMWITVGLLLWGGFLALGALRVGGNHAALRGAIVFACTLVFVGFWWAALYVRQRRMNADEDI